MVQYTSVGGVTTIETQQFETLLAKVDALIHTKPRVLVAIDGYCTSGKTTLAEWLQKRYDCNLFHMDDFFLRPWQRTEKRLNEVGGNVDYERFLEEVLLPLTTGKDFSYRPYDCHSASLLAPVTVTSKAFNVIEGTYSMHPSLASFYDFSIFLCISPELQRERILQRDASLHQSFFEKWIPMENRYFKEGHIVQQCDAVLHLNPNEDYRQRNLPFNEKNKTDT